MLLLWCIFQCENDTLHSFAENSNTFSCSPLPINGAQTLSPLTKIHISSLLLNILSLYCCIYPHDTYSSCSKLSASLKHKVGCVFDPNSCSLRFSVARLHIPDTSMPTLIMWLNLSSNILDTTAPSLFLSLRTYHPETHLPETPLFTSKKTPEYVPTRQPTATMLS